MALATVERKSRHSQQRSINDHIEHRAAHDTISLSFSPAQHNPELTLHYRHECVSIPVKNASATLEDIQPTISETVYQHFHVRLHHKWKLRNMDSSNHQIQKMTPHTKYDLEEDIRIIIKRYNADTDIVTNYEYLDCYPSELQSAVFRKCMLKIPSDVRFCFEQNSKDAYYGVKRAASPSALQEIGIKHGTVLSVRNVVSRSPDMQITVQTLAGAIAPMSFEVHSDYAVYDIKYLIERVVGIPILQQRLIFAGKLTEDAHSVARYGIVNGSILHLVCMLSVYKFNQNY